MSKFSPDPRPLQAQAYKCRKQMYENVHMITSIIIEDVDVFIHVLSNDASRPFDDWCHLLDTECNYILFERMETHVNWLLLCINKWMNNGWIITDQYTTNMYVCKIFRVFLPIHKNRNFIYFQRRVRLSPPAASVDNFSRRRNRAVFRVLQGGRSGMPGAGGRLRLPSLGTESTTSNSSSQGSGGVSQLQKEQHRVVVMG
jgi:hypothetical protein